MSPDRIGNQNQEIHLQPTIEPPRDRRGRIRWSVLRRDQELLVRVIESEAQGIISSGFELTPKQFQESGRGDLENAIYKYYPGGRIALIESLGVDTTRRPNGYWTEEKIREEAGQIFQQEGKLTQAVIVGMSRSRLVRAISNFYPGGLRQLRKDFNTEYTAKPVGYWTPEQIEIEAQSFYIQNGDISNNKMRRDKAGALAGAITRFYPGGWPQLRKNLGIELPRVQRGYWTQEEIERKALEFYQKHGQISRYSLSNNGEGALGTAISSTYGGSYVVLRERLGIPASKRRKRGYWTSENIAVEALEFFNTFGVLTYPALTANKYYGLQSAIHRSPGGLRGLKLKLGIEKTKQDSVPSEEANQQLRRLLEG
ncbi:MAG: hypothetical protein AAB414_02035 [Patescibacteria group bacterium]